MELGDINIVDEAQEILRGKSRPPQYILKLSRRLKNERQIGYARRILARARKGHALKDVPGEDRLKIFQQSALCTFKDADLPVDRRLDRALEILREVEDLSRTTNQETLGLAGSIHKQKWQVDNQKPQLERALFYYLRGYDQGVERDQGYTGINAAYVLDLLAHQEEREAVKAGIPEDSAEFKQIEARRDQARQIREDIIRKVSTQIDAVPAEKRRGMWWFYSTVAEALFGLGRYDAKNYDKAVAWLNRGRAEAGDVGEWELEATTRQLAAIAQLQSPAGVSGQDLDGTPPWRALAGFFERPAAVRSAFVGKVGLGLSGGGFRASLFHIGVLAKLAELDVLRSVEVLSCVSGGSIIGAHYYLEVRKLLREKADEEITRDDYIRIVERVRRDFLEGVQRNVRTRVASEPLTNLKMIFGADSGVRKWIFGPSYSRTMRAGELFESEIFDRVEDGEGGGPRWLNELKITPKGESEDFSPKYHNWRREAKVPILILNAATLNTGHSWHFTVSYMGEPPAGIDSEIDGNDRLRRLYYEEAPEGHTRVRLGHAVAASACVPGLFEPLALEGLYPDRVVRLIDGGTCDNQGVGGLLEQDCNVLLISDGSGQMESLKDPSRGLLGVPLRSTTILQSRVRQAQYQELASRKRSGLLRGLMFIHLKDDLDVDPIDWVDCLDPYEADDDDSRPAGRRGKLTRYGIAKEMQQQLASVRTDLDSFSDVEAFALMTSAYRQTEYAFEETKCVEGFAAPAERKAWDFLAVEGGMKGAGKPYQFVKRLLGVSDTLAFKIWKLKKSLRVTAVALAVAAVAFVLALLGWGIWWVWEHRRDMLGGAVTVGALVGVLVCIVVGVILGIAFLSKTKKGDTLVRVALGVAGVLGSLVAKIHLRFFDSAFLKEGSLENYERQLRPSPARATPRAERPPTAEAPRAHEAPRPEEHGVPPGQARQQAASPETVTVGKGVEAQPLSADPDIAAGNGRAKDPAADDDEQFPERFDVRDSGERKE